MRESSGNTDWPIALVLIAFLGLMGWIAWLVFG